MIPITKETVSMYTRTEGHSDTTGFVSNTWTFAFKMRADIQDFDPSQSERKGFGASSKTSKYCFSFRNTGLVHGMQLRRENSENYIVNNPSHLDNHTEFFLVRDESQI